MKIKKFLFGDIEYTYSTGSYFKSARNEIAIENMRTLQMACFFGFFVTLILLLITPLIIPEWVMTWQYYCLMPMELVFFILSSSFLNAKKRTSATISELICASFFILLLAVFISLSIFPYPDTPQIFITICFFLIPTLLIQRYSVTLTIMGVAELIYLILGFRYKTPECMEQNLFNTVATIFFSMIIMELTTRLHVREYWTRCTFKHLSMTDRLTGLMNKGEFESTCREALENGSHKQYALLVIDLDNFKKINDTYGHQGGDVLIKHFANKLSAHFGEASLIGRIGGDEFSVMIPSLREKEDLEARINTPLRSMKGCVYESQMIRYSCSIGGAVSSVRPASYDALFREADTALYDVKEQGKGRYRLTVIEELPDMSAPGLKS